MKKCFDFQLSFRCVNSSSVLLVLLVLVELSAGQFEVINEPVSPYSNNYEPHSSSDSTCCDETMIIKSSTHPEGYLKAPPVYDEMSDPKNSKRIVECLYKFYGNPDERVQLFYEDFDLYYPYDIYKFNKIDCRYADSICLKFYDTNSNDQDANTINAESVSIESHNYDLCNCINVSYTPRQIMSAGSFMQVRFKTVVRKPYESSLVAGLNFGKIYRGYLIRYRFVKDFGIDTREGGLMDKSNNCKVYFYSMDKNHGYFTSPNYPGLYPRDIECHYYFIGQKNEKVQIAFHTFDVEGVDLCKPETKSDYVELSNFQNKDRAFQRFCGTNKPGAIISDRSFFHVTFYSNNVFDGKGFQASYHFINYSTDNSGMLTNSKSVGRSGATGTGGSNGETSATEAVTSRSAARITAALYLVITLAFLPLMMRRAEN